SGPAHKSGRRGQTHSDKFSCYTVLFKDKEDQQMYFYRKKNKSFWSRVHVPEKIEENQKLWNDLSKNMYIPITKAEF
ncbi:hypothetical protein K435DRAFT_584958, partial [Dendrothele bispora CBS 962.96]